MYYFYVIENEESQLYYGSTNDLKRRLSEHREDRSFATKGHDWNLVYYEAYAAESDARRRERRVKDHGQAGRQLRERIRDSRRRES